MKKAIYSFIYYHLLGWKTNVTVPNYDKCVICAAPHTTNMDLFIGKLFYGAIGRKTSFMMKKEWFFFPLGILFKAVGGIPVNRGRKSLQSLPKEPVNATPTGKKDSTTSH